MGIFDKLKKKRAVSEILQEALNEEKEDMIRGVVDLSDTAVKEVMIPRIDVDFIPLDMETEELLKRVAESGHSRFPVYAESIDNVVGVLYVKDLINSFAKKEPIDLEKIIRKPFFVPESKRIDGLLREFKRRHVHIAIAVDEYGGISGTFKMSSIMKMKISFPSAMGFGSAMPVSIWMIWRRLCIRSFPPMSLKRSAALYLIYSEKFPYVTKRCVGRTLILSFRIWTGIK